MGKGKSGKIRASHILVEKHSKAVELIRKIVEDGEDFLFVGTKKQAKENC